MVALLLLTLLQATPPPAAPKPQPPATPAPAAPAAATPRPRPVSTTTAALLFITDGAGHFIPGVAVHVMGPVDREVTSADSGPTRIEGLRAGSYRVRFTHDKFITFEKEIAWRAGAAAPELSITLTPAPAPPPPPPAPPAPVVTAPPTAKLPPAGSIKTVGVPEFIEKNFISGREPQKESVIGCSGLEQAMLWQIREPWTGRQQEQADAMFYVIGGEGRLKLGEREFNVAAGAFAVVPRGTTYSLSRNGRNPLIVLAVLAGVPCTAD